MVQLLAYLGGSSFGNGLKVAKSKTGAGESPRKNLAWLRPRGKVGRTQAKAGIITFSAFYSREQQKKQMGEKGICRNLKAERVPRG